MSNPIEVATAAYATAAAIDPAMPDPSELRIRAWAQVFDGQQIGVAEAIAAVTDYYRGADRYPIKPGDVLAAVRAMPLTSSPERIAAFIDRWSVHPYSTAIQRLTGMDWAPPFPVPTSVNADDAQELRAFHLREFQRWIARNRSTLITRALANGEQLELG